MNILKLAKHLKEFTLDEINMIAECDVENELKQLLNSHNIVFQQGVYKYVEEKEKADFAIFIDKKPRKKSLTFDAAIKLFLKNYAKKCCTKRTVETYESIFRMHIVPFFNKKLINDVTKEDIKNFYNSCKRRNVEAKRLKNILTQLNQLLKYCKAEGLIQTCCNFQVRRLTSKNEFSINRIIFEGE